MPSTFQSLTPTEEEFLNLGFDCDIPSTYDPLTKTELEHLYQEITDLTDKKIIQVNNRLAPLLKIEVVKTHKEGSVADLTKTQLIYLSVFIHINRVHRMNTIRKEIA